MKKLILLLLILLALGAGMIYTGLMPAAFYDLVDAYAPAAVSEVIHRAAGTVEPRETPRAELPQALDFLGDMQPEEYGDITGRIVEGIRAQRDGIAIPVELPQGSDDEITDYLLRQVELSIEVVRRDLPELFWISLGSYVIEWTGDRQAGQGVLTAYIDYCHTPEEVAEMTEEMEHIIADILASAPREPAGAVAYFHDWIIDNATYASDLAGEDISMHGYEYGFNIDGIFLNGRAVCEGYSKAFKLLCDRRGIPCVIVFGTAKGENHSWNYVELDGRWYLVDPTWDDPVGAEPIRLDDYLLKGSQSEVDGQTVRETYHPDNGDYPPLSREAFEVS